MWQFSTLFRSREIPLDLRKPQPVAPQRGRLAPPGSKVLCALAPLVLAALAFHVVNLGVYFQVVHLLLEYIDTVFSRRSFWAQSLLIFSASFRSGASLVFMNVTHLVMFLSAFLYVFVTCGLVFLWGHGQLSSLQ